MAATCFKTCSCCGRSWQTRDAFLSDGELKVEGYTADFESLERGLFFVTHRSRECGSTMAFEAQEFLDLYTGPRYPQRKALSDECPRYCLDEKQLGRCTVLCECAFVREVLQVLMGRLDAARANSPNP